MLREVYVVLRRIWWWITDRCPHCGVDTIDWSGYMSTCFVCPLCDMELHKSRIYKELFPGKIEKYLSQYKKIWSKNYE